MIFGRHANLKYRDGKQKILEGLLCGYSGKNSKQIEEYIRNQLKEDYMVNQISLFEIQSHLQDK